ncbi:hypothetical protein HYU50_01010 [Candidatus Woesearchaeota archaeon]|nr:hypothetical protein [Candidatus Woesearchaeota archaeon]
MALETIILLAVILLIIALVWGFLKHIKHIFRMLVPVGIVILLIIAATTFFIYRDIADLRDKLKDSTKKIILVDNDEVITGFILKSQVGFLTDEQIEEFSTDLQNKDYGKILGSGYRLMVFDIGIINKLNADNIGINRKTITKSYAISVLRSDNPGEMLRDKRIYESDLEISKKDMEDNSRVKAALFGIVLSDEVLSPKNPLLLFSGFKEGSIIVYPETAVFKAANVLPLSFIGSAGKAIFREKEQVEVVVEEAQ